MMLIAAIAGIVLAGALAVALQIPSHADLFAGNGGIGGAGGAGGVGGNGGVNVVKQAAGMIRMLMVATLMAVMAEIPMAVTLVTKPVACTGFCFYKTKSLIRLLYPFDGKIQINEEERTTRKCIYIYMEMRIDVLTIQKLIR